eukprot:225274-Hanusia_phi.AAC.1
MLGSEAQAGSSSQRVHPAGRAVRALVVTRVQREQVAGRPAVERVLQRVVGCKAVAPDARAIQLQAVDLTALYLEPTHEEVLLRAQLQAGAHLHRKADVAEAVLPRPTLVGVQEARPLPALLPRTLACPPGAHRTPCAPTDRRPDAVQHLGWVAHARRQKVGVVLVTRVRVHLQDAALVRAPFDLRVGDGGVGAVPQYARLDRGQRARRGSAVGATA